MNTLAHPLQPLGLPPGSFAVGRRKRQRVYAFEIHMDDLYPPSHDRIQR